MSLTTNSNDISIPVCTFGKQVVGIMDKAGNGPIEMETTAAMPYRQAINKNTERQILYVTGPSGSGKSWFTKQFIEDYHKAYPKRPVYVFSALTCCATLDKLKYLKRIKIKESKFLGMELNAIDFKNSLVKAKSLSFSCCATLDKLKYLKRIKIKESKFLNMELNAVDFKDSLVIFDDCDCIVNKLMKEKVMDILNSILETGRHESVSVVFTSHLATAGNMTKRILNEAHAIVIYPANMGTRQLKYLLAEYLGFSKAEIKKVKKTNGRWCSINKTYPMTFFDEKTIHIKQIED